MTILELIQKTTAYFEKANVPNPRLDVELILAHVLRLKRMELYLQFERGLTSQELDSLRPLVKRRADREPLQHILGTIDFFGLELQTTPQALIPRPETEILVQTAVVVLGKESDAKIGDVGTGSGAIALAILHACPSVTCVATDISQEALTLARSNAEKIGLSVRIDFRLGNLFETMLPGETWDMIVSNPPYIPSDQIPKLQPEVRHDPIQALDGGIDGLEIVRKLISDSTNFLKKNGWLIFEIGHDQSSEVKKLLEANEYTSVEIVQDLQKYPRVVKAQKSS